MTSLRRVCRSHDSVVESSDRSYESNHEVIGCGCAGLDHTRTGNEAIDVFGDAAGRGLKTPVVSSCLPRLDLDDLMPEFGERFGDIRVARQVADPGFQAMQQAREFGHLQLASNVGLRHSAGPVLRVGEYRTDLAVCLQE
ncbi:hypothetical protein OG874_35725 [Nocardia sp. NBC_00565]|uniref:hypothetical protein n=1 Tax=Nocardia sp. NBC_00565 TaxID=2975993 RepID=UPI002E81DDC5|nr:hypothetical protein [Nocardia sp. NBC_00565]WUC02041.1 hypothetical protein OG874_35725 [Nocardia sp. NBC_00565]